MARSLTRIILGLSIKNKIVMVVMVTSVISLLLTFTIFLIYSINQLESKMVEELEVLGTVIGDRSAAALIYGDAQAVQENLSAFRARNSIIFACVYNDKQEIFGRYNTGTVERTCPEVPQVGHSFGKRELAIYKKIVDTNETIIGGIYIVSNLLEVERLVQRYTILSLLFVLLGMLIAYLITLNMHSFVTRPIDKLVTTAREVSEHHNYSLRVIKTTYDELGVLVEAFNDMLFQIHERDKEIQSAKDDLEQRVVERTRDLEQAKVAAEQANKSKSMFLANMSHELRTPMHAILSYSEFGIEEIDESKPDDLKSYFERIAQSGKRLLGLLNNLLDLSKLESGKMEFHMTEHDLAQAMNRVISELQALLNDKKLTLTIDKPEFPTLAVFDLDKILQVLTNFLSNAIKFSPEAGTLTASFTRRNLIKNGVNQPMLVFSLRDEGVGVPEEEKLAIFETFIQSSHTKTGAGGTGLGLAICKEIIEAHHGLIWCENNSDRAGKTGATPGATFSFAIPLQSSHDEHSKPDSGIRD